MITHKIRYTEKFPKAQNRFRGEAMVLLALARQQATQTCLEDVLRIIDERIDYCKKCKISPTNQGYRNGVKNAIQLELEELKAKVKRE